MKNSLFVSCIVALIFALCIGVPGLEAAQQKAGQQDLVDHNAGQQHRTVKTGFSMAGIMRLMPIVFVLVLAALPTGGEAAGIKQRAWDEYITAVDLYNDLRTMHRTKDYDNPIWKENLAMYPLKGDEYVSLDNMNMRLVQKHNRNAESARDRYLALATDAEVKKERERYRPMKSAMTDYIYRDNINHPRWEKIRALRKAHKEAGPNECDQPDSELEALLQERYEIINKMQALKDELEASCDIEEECNLIGVYENQELNDFIEAERDLELMIEDRRDELKRPPYKTVTDCLA